MTLLTPAEVSAKTRIPVNTLRYYRHIGTGPQSFRLGGRKVVYREVDVDAWIAAQFADQTGGQA